jgi:riboflavin kinase/FMN adenylyltransferase
MRVLSDLDSVSELIGPSVLTVGNFDGVHLGHQAILRETVRVARAIRRPAVVLTFEPHPQRIFKGKQAPPLLCTLSQKISLFGTLGIEATIVCPFDENIYRYTADEFFSEVLVVRLGAVHVVEGEDFTFGKGRTGSPERLTKLGRDHGMGVTIVDPVILEGEAISSSRIRAAIQKGDVAKARLLLGRPYEVAARKVSGKGRGRTLGYPTVNLASENELLPEIGVYAVQSECDGRVYQGAASLGFNPTFEGDRFSFEVYLLDFDGSVRDDQVRVRFHRRLRDEIRFDRRQDLIDQIAADVAQVKTVFLTEER